MTFRFNAASSARGATGLARQASRRISVLTPCVGDASATARAVRRGGRLSRPTSTIAAAGALKPSRLLSSLAAPVEGAAAGIRSAEVGFVGSDTLMQATGGRTRRITAPPVGVTAAGGFSSRRVFGQSSAGAAIALPGSVGGVQRWRGLATNPAAATEGAVEERGGGGAAVSSGANRVGSNALAATLDSSGDASNDPSLPHPPRHGGVEDHSGSAVAEPKPGSPERRRQHQAQQVSTCGGAGGGGGDLRGVSGSDGSDGAAAAAAAAAATDGANSAVFLTECSAKLRDFAKDGDGDQAIALIAQMREAGVTPTEKNYTSAINACKNGTTSQWKEALALLKEISAVGGGVRPNTFHYAAAMKACEDAGQLDKIPALKSEMEGIGLTPGLRYYHWGIKAAGGHADAAQGWEAVKDLVQEMSEKGVVPNRNTYDLVEKARSRLGLSIGVADEHSGIKIAGETSGDGDGSGGEVERLVSRLQGIDGAPPPARRAAAKGENPAVLLKRCNKMLKECAKDGDGDKAIALIARMREDGVTPSEASYSFAINACKNGSTSQWKEALALLKETSTVGGGVGPSAFFYTAAMKTCEAAGQLDMIPTLKAEMEAKGIIPGLKYYHWGIKVAGGHADPSQGWEWTNDLVQEMSEREVVPNRHTYALVKEAGSQLGLRSSTVDVRSGSRAEGGSACGDGDCGGEVERLVSLLQRIQGAPPPATNAAVTRPSEQRGDSKPQQSLQKEGGGAGRPKQRSSSAQSKRGARAGLGSLSALTKELRRYSDLGEGDKATDLIARMREAGVPPTDKNYTSAINACKNCGQWEQALALLRGASDSGIALNAYHYVAAIKACGDAGQWNQVPVLVNEMQSRAGVSPGTDFYNWAIKAASSPMIGRRVWAVMTREGRWRVRQQGARKTSSDGGQDHSKSPSSAMEAVTALRREMREKGVAPDSGTYTLIMAACRADGRPESSLAVLREMQELAAAAARVKQVVPSAAAGVEAVAGGVEGEALAGVTHEADASTGKQAADTTVPEVRDGSRGGDAGSGALSSPAAPTPFPLPAAVDDSTPSVMHYSSVMAAFADHPGGSKHVLTLMKEMEVAGVAPNAATYNSAIRACGKDGRWAEAVAMFRRMSKRGVLPDEVSFLAAIEACGKGGEWALAIALLREMSKTSAAGRTLEPTVKAYTAALTACGNAGQWQMALGLLREVTDGADVAVGTRGSTDLDVAHARSGDVGDAAAAAADSGGNEDDPGSAAAAADMEKNDGGSDRRVLSSSSSPLSPPLPPAPVPLAPDVFLYNAAIEACGRAGEWHRALQLLSEISAVGLSPTVVSYNSAVACCSAADEWVKALSLIDEMRLVGLRPVSSTYLPAIEACKRAGEHAIGYRLTREMHTAQRNMQQHPDFRSMKRRERTLHV